MSRTYSDVDASADPTGAADWQLRMSTWPAVRAYKQRTYELVRDFGTIVDIGSGPGVDIAALAGHGPAGAGAPGGPRCVGVDPSDVMARRAASLGAAVVRGDAHHLPFATGAFGAARADRVFQHLAHPHDALREMVRVVAPGGRVVIADPDQETLAIEVPGVRRGVLDRLKSLRRDIGYRNGRVASRLPALLGEAGADEITVDAFPLIVTDPDDAFGLPTWPVAWRTEGRFTDEELAEWDRAMREPTDGFLYVVTFLVVAGRVT